MTHGGHKDSTLKKAREAGVNHAIMNPAVSGARLPKCSNGNPTTLHFGMNMV